MKIGIISNLYPPHERGGAELVARRIADELSKRGHEVSVLTSRPFFGWNSLGLDLQEKHLERVYRFHPINLFGIENIGKKPFLWRLLWHAIDAVSPGVRSVIHRWILEEQPDVILTHNLKGVGLSIGRIIQESGIRHVHTIHDVQLTVPSGLLMWGQEDSFLNRSLLRRWYERLSQWAIGKPDVVISPSQFLLDLHCARGFFLEKKTVVLPNPAPPVLVPNRIKERTGPIRFLFAGQLESHKGILFLMHALNTLDLPYELHVAGDGSLRTEIEERGMRDPRLMFHGFEALNPLLKLIATVDAVIVPSLCYENSPTIIYESFAVGTPVIASRIGGIPELIVEGENGWLFEAGNQESFLHALKKFLENPEEYWRRSAHIREMAEKYALKTYVDTLEKMIQA
jgi:glycosyltransferase involved in cell wall biosynthesis